MKQCKAILKKEWWTHRKSFLMPLWFTLGVYATVLIGWIISLIKGDGIVHFMQAQERTAGMENLMLYIGSGGATALLGFVSLLTALSLSDLVINGGFKNRCEILHFSQPVSFAKIALSKYFFVSLATVLLFGILSLLNSLFISLFTGYVVKSQLYYGLVAWLQTWIGTSLSIIFVGSVMWFFAGMFRRNSFFLGTLVILGIQAIISILNYFTGWSIPSLLGYLARLIAISVSFNPDVNSVSMPELNMIIQMAWQKIVSWDSLLKVIYSAVLFLGGAYLYKRRELS